MPSVSVTLLPHKHPFVKTKQDAADLKVDYIFSNESQAGDWTPDGDAKNSQMPR